MIDFSPLAHTPKQGRVVPRDVGYGIVHFKNSRENGYKLWAQWFGGQALFMIGGWYSRQPLTNLLANPNNPRNRYLERLYTFSL